MKTDLSDMQRILLSTASQREDGHVLPLPETLKGKEGPSKPALTALLKKELISETHTKNPAQQWREDGEWRIGLIIAQAGLEAIGVVGEASLKRSSSEVRAHNRANPAPSHIPSRRAGTKQGAVIALLKRENGASLTEIVDATGWLAHTSRAALTGLKKKGYLLEKDKTEGVTRYRITGENGSR
jgi:hypothetical protein